MALYSLIVLMYLSKTTHSLRRWPDNTIILKDESDVCEARVNKLTLQDTKVRNTKQFKNKLKIYLQSAVMSNNALCKLLMLYMYCVFCCWLLVNITTKLVRVGVSRLLLFLLFLLVVFLYCHVWLL